MEQRKFEMRVKELEASSMKAVKLSPHNDDKDDLDAYLCRLEQACQALIVSLSIGQLCWPNCCKERPWMF